MAKVRGGNTPAKSLAWEEKPRVVVQFRAEFDIPYRDGAEEVIEKLQIGSWKKLREEFPNITLKTLFRTTKVETLHEMVDRARTMDPTYKPGHFTGYFYVDTPDVIDLERLVKILLRWPAVQAAYIDRPAPDPVVNPANDPRFVNQGYLDPAPDGIDAEYAWGFPGGDGAGQRVIDLERGWTFNHEDLTAHGSTMLHGTLLDSSRSHGTSVLGEICAVDNTLGCVGIVPNIAHVNTVSFHGSTRPDAIIAAVGHLAFGDVLLLEAQVAVDGVNLLGPIEAFDAEFDAIRLATALGVIVVEAGGNGTNNGFLPPLAMDTFIDPMGRAIFNTASPDFRDSGAIIVTAATSTAPHSRMPWAPHGQRIDCYGWGENINTLASNGTGSTTMYRTDFGGTSGASPIITGAALAVQGMAEAQLGIRFSPRQMRAILRNPATGTPRAGTEVTAIGVMPNLRSIIDGNVLGLAPDVYIRDFVGDSGEPHSGAISASPDIILLPSAVANPQAAFGAGSGTENDAALGYTAEAGQNNIIYVRVLNQGGSAAANVNATVFWSEVSTLVTPDLWHLVGSITIPNVPTGEVLTVSNGITWPSAAIPATGHYCFVGILDHPNDPAPSPGDLLNWTNFTKFIRENNNVTWRNFNVEDNDPMPDPQVPKGMIALPFLVPGAFDKARRFDIEVLGKLPDGARLILEVPLAFMQLMHEPYQKVEIDEKRRVALIRLRPSGRHRLPSLLLPAKSRHRLRLLVSIPEALRKHSYQVAVRQIWEKEEVGRVTWLLAPGVRKKRKKG